MTTALTAAQQVAQSIDVGVQSPNKLLSHVTEQLHSPKEWEDFLRAAAAQGVYQKIGRMAQNPVRTMMQWLFAYCDVVVRRDEVEGLTIYRFEVTDPAEAQPVRRGATGPTMSQITFRGAGLSLDYANHCVARINAEGGVDAGEIVRMVQTMELSMDMAQVSMVGNHIAHHLNNFLVGRLYPLFGHTHEAYARALYYPFALANRILAMRKAEKDTLVYDVQARIATIRDTLSTHVPVEGLVMESSTATRMTTLSPARAELAVAQNMAGPMPSIIEQTLDKMQVALLRMPPRQGITDNMGDVVESLQRTEPLGLRLYIPLRDAEGRLATHVEVFDFNLGRVFKIPLRLQEVDVVDADANDEDDVVGVMVCYRLMFETRCGAFLQKKAIRVGRTEPRMGIETWRSNLEYKILTCNSMMGISNVDPMGASTLPALDLRSLQSGGMLSSVVNPGLWNAVRLAAQGTVPVDFNMGAGKDLMQSVHPVRRKDNAYGMHERDIAFVKALPHSLDLQGGPVSADGLEQVYRYDPRKSQQYLTTDSEAKGFQEPCPEGAEGDTYVTIFWLQKYKVHYAQGDPVEMGGNSPIAFMESPEGFRAGLGQ